MSWTKDKGTDINIIDRDAHTERIDEIRKHRRRVDDPNYFIRKHDFDKARMELLPLEAVSLIAEIMTYGADKYGDNNWQSLPNGTQRYLGAALRHLAKYQDGEVYDRESGLPHMAHAACSLLFVLDIERRLGMYRNRRFGAEKVPEKAAL
jgi:hypothetical protein